MKKQAKNKNRIIYSPGRPGFTLIEIVLYLAIASVIVLLSAFFIQNLLGAKAKNLAIAEVDEQGAQELELMDQIIRNSRAINSPSPGDSSSSLSLDVEDGAKSPTIFDVSGGALRIKEGDGSAVSLTGNRSRVQEIHFKNLSRPGTPGIVRIELTLEYASSGQSQAYQYSKIFYASAALR